MNNTVLIDPLETDVAAFLDYVTHERRLSENTRLVYKRGLGRFAQFVHGGGVADYLAPQAAEIASYLEALHQQGLAAASRCMAVTTLRLFYWRMVALGRLAAAAARPVVRLANPNVPERLPRILTVEEVRRLLDAPCKTHRMYLRDKALLEFLYASACRASEAAGLRLDNLDLDAASGRVLGKGNKERIVLLGEYAVQHLHTYIHLLRPHLVRRHSDPPPWLFVSRAGRQLDRELVWALVKGYALKAGLPDCVNVHTLRHAAATHVLCGGADVRFAQEILGHANATTTTVYLHVDVSHLRKAHERFLVYRQKGDAPRSAPQEALPSPQPASPAPLLPLSHDRNLWGREEDELVRALPAREAAQRTGRSLGAVKWRRQVLGVKTVRLGLWTPAEDELLRTLPTKEAAARLPGRTRAAIKHRQQVLGVKSTWRWTAEQDELVRTLPVGEVGRLTGRTCGACKERRKTLRLTSKWRWTAEEDRLLQTLPVAEAAERTARTVGACKRRRQVLRRRQAAVGE